MTPTGAGDVPAPAQTMQDKHAISKPAQDAPSSPGSPVREHAATGAAVPSLWARNFDTRHEGVRIVAGFALLVGVGVTALNVALWHNSSKRIESEAWQRLEAATDVRRAEVDHVFEVFRREALSVARDPSIVASVRSVRMDMDPSTRVAALVELWSRAGEFDFARITLVGPTARQS